MKQYRPVSADFTKLSGSLSSMFTNDNDKPASNNVLLITYKKSVSEAEGCSPPLSPTSKLGKTDQARVLLREDDVHQLEFNNQGQVCRSKPRRKVSCKKTPTHVTQTQKTEVRTVTTLMGGRGYIQWRAAQMERHKTSHLAQINNSDAYLVIWDHKL